MKIQDIGHKEEIDTWCDGCDQWATDKRTIYRIDLPGTASYTLYTCFLEGMYSRDICSATCFKVSLKQLLEELK